MKFLVMATRRQQPPVPPDAMPAILSAQREWLSDRRADGTIDVVYAFSELGGIAIANARSGEELNAMLLSSPAFLLNDWEIRPLVDIDIALTNAAETFERMSVGVHA